MENLSDTLRIAFFAAAASVTLFLGSPADAFHAGGVGDCAGCHTMHNLSGGEPRSSTPNPSFLIASDSSSVCLSCHQKTGDPGPAGYHISTAEADMPAGTPPLQLTPGGDFGWLKKTYGWDPGSGEASGQSPGERHGHNIVAADYGYVPDSTLPAAPGGTYGSGILACVSCHDPHGRYRRFVDGTIGTTGLATQTSGSYETSPDPTEKFAVGVYRLLGGRGYKISASAAASFTEDPPAAVVPSDYNRSEESSATRVAYGKGMSEWCRNCHAGMGTGGSGNGGHPAGTAVRFTAEIAGNYNAYLGSGNLNGNSSTSYMSLVPYEMGTADYTLLKKTANRDGSIASGPDTNSNVMCLSCHRAHATGWDKAARWNMKTEFLVYNGDYPGVDRSDVPARFSQGRTKAETRRAFHEQSASKLSAYQRSLCNKCHTKD
jgi:hypothetical protein